MTYLTRVQLEALLDGSINDHLDYDHDTGEVYLLHQGVIAESVQPCDGPLLAAAPDLARQLLATLDALAEARAAQALVVERAERDALKKKLISPDPYEDTAHPDDHAVNRFAAVMKGKLAAKRLQGRGGWQEPEVPNGYLSRMLREHVDKGDPVDVANLAMLIHQRGERIAPQNEGASCKAIDDAIADRDRLAAANAVLEAKVAGLRDFVDDFAKAKIDALRYSPPYGSSPEDEPDPVVDAKTVWAWQADAKAALATQEAGT